MRLLVAGLGAIALYFVLLGIIYRLDRPAPVEPVAEPQTDVELLWECAAERAVVELPAHLRAMGQFGLAVDVERDWCGCEQPALYHCAACPLREWVGGPMRGQF